MAAALVVQWTLREEREQTARWRARAYEAEARIALLRAAPPAVADAREGPPPVAAAPEPEPDPKVEREPEMAAGPAVDREPAAPPPEDPVWDALAAGHLEAEVERQLSRELSADQEARLLDRLRDVREAGAKLDADPGGDPLAGARQRLSRSIVLLEADQAFREELGMGLGAFLRRVDAEQVEDVNEQPPELAQRSQPPEPREPPRVPEPPRHSQSAGSYSGVGMGAGPDRRPIGLDAWPDSAGADPAPAD
jgi:hypothetical protein